MNTDTQDIYYNPEKYGMTLIKALDDPDACYDFNMFCVWQEDATGKLFYAEDSGCSCPTPFEDTSLTELTNDNAGWAAFQAALTEYVAYLTEGADGPASPLHADSTQLLEKVARIQREQARP